MEWALALIASHLMLIDVYLDVSIYFFLSFFFKFYFGELVSVLYVYVSGRIVFSVVYPILNNIQSVKFMHNFFGA